MPCPAMLIRRMPCHAVLCRAIPCPAVLCAGHRGAQHRRCDAGARNGARACAHPALLHAPAR
eukprot:324786-Chlamydomonas_euryale.AAC.2